MSRPVLVENDALRLQVWPQFGGKVASIVDKVDGFDLMFDYPAEFPTKSQYDQPFDDSWYAGWDECFPAVAPGKYPNHPYTGIAVPDHGEVRTLPTTAVPSMAGITTVWHGLRFGYRLTRKLRIEGASILAEYTLVNLAPFEFRFVWSMHALLSMVSPLRLDVPGGPYRLSHDADGVDLDRPFDWPLAGEGVDLSDPAGLPQRRGWKAYSTHPISSPVMLRYPERGRSVLIQYSSTDNLPAYWGVWVNTGGWGGNQHLAIEPTTGRFDQLDRSITDDSAGRVPASGRVDWAVKWTLAGV